MTVQVQTIFNVQTSSEARVRFLLVQNRKNTRVQLQRVVKFMTICIIYRALLLTIARVVFLILPFIMAELVFVVSGTTNMYPGYGIVYKNVPVFGHCRKMYPALIVVYPKSNSRSSRTGFDVT